MILTRQMRSEHGIFGTLHMPETTYATLEHAYRVGDVYAPKLPEGEYLCVKGTHRLEGMNHSFETFEVTNVPGHTGILFHVGNYNRDSNGCILLGSSYSQSSPPMIIASNTAFRFFLCYLKDVSQFELTVQDDYES